MNIHSSILFSNSFKSSSTNGLGHQTLNRKHFVYEDRDLLENYEAPSQRNHPSSFFIWGTAQHTIERND
jgi:hypothetical protein